MLDSSVTHFERKVVRIPGSGKNTPWTTGWSRLRDRTLAVKSRKIAGKSYFVKKNSFLSTPEVGEKQKMERKKKVCINTGQQFSIDLIHQKS